MVWWRLSLKYSSTYITLHFAVKFDICYPLVFKVLIMHTFSTLTFLCLGFGPSGGFPPMMPPPGMGMPPSGFPPGAPNPQVANIQQTGSASNSPAQADLKPEKVSYISASKCECVSITKVVVI